jgi:ABC-type Fe3+ transport system permease subunit
MLVLILLFLEFILFTLSFIFIILDIKNYKENRYEDLKSNELPKRSSQSLLFSLLSIVVAVITSLAY